MIRDTKLELNKLKKYANEQGYDILDTEYTDVTTRMLFQHNSEACNHYKFTMTWACFKYSGCRCKECYVKSRKSDFESIKAFALKENYLILSKSYSTNKDNLLFKHNIKTCNYIFRMMWKNFKAGYRCPRCAEFITERECRDIFERLTGKPFNKIRPEWITNKNKQKLELDGYNEELNLAFEYNGYQHYNYPNCFHKTEEQFLKTIDHDIIKAKACKDHNVHLIVIPHTIPFTKLEQYIIEQLDLLIIKSQTI